MIDLKTIPADPPADPPAYSGRELVTSQPQPTAGPSQPIASPSYAYPPPQTLSPQRSNVDGWPVTTPPTEMSDAQLGTMFQNQLYARCARGDHSLVSKHGAVGIICAVIMFPIGFTCFFLDVEKKCERCGTVVSRWRK
ncbi:hypothetical protein QCA50_003944 [Cerrena zonata]|uniref:Brain protein I3 n=1 Tax=Cerrena zonata TaxID=2478898 RepID=A0AAW0GRY7_9APHY